MPILDSAMRKFDSSGLRFSIAQVKMAAAAEDPHALKSTHKSGDQARPEPREVAERRAKSAVANDDTIPLRGLNLTRDGMMIVSRLAL